MEQNQNLQHYKAITRLKLLDIKAQKKTIPYKKFCNIPLSQQEQLKQKYQLTRFKQLENNQNIYPGNQTKYSFRKSLNRLAKPRSLANLNSSKDSQVQKILRRCKKLMNCGSKVKNQMSNFQKNSRLCLNSIEKKMNNLISDGLYANYYM